MLDINYWLTTHWPPRVGDGRDPNGIWLPEGREMAGNDLKSGDLVFVYESSSGRDELQTKLDGSTEIIRSIWGKEGVIALCRLTRGLAADGVDEETIYRHGPSIWWRWYAPTETISTAGLIPRLRLNEILSYKPKYNYHAAGDKKSGLKKLTKQQFDDILAEFRKGEGEATRTTRLGHPGPEGGGESDAHRHLKEYVASNPASILGEPGLETKAVEFEFPSHDRADLYFHDQFGKVIGGEVEVDVGPADIVGPLQALKYKAMLEFMANRPKNEGRAFLIAYTISDEILKKCKKYGIECFTIDRETIESWVKSQEHL